MTRRRVNLTLVPNEAARKTTYKKRTQGLTKKMEELTTLCGVDGCIVIYKPQEDEPHVWPSKEKATELLAKYESMPKTDQDTKKLDHEKFMADRVEKLREQIAKQEKKNKEARASLLMHEMSLGRKMEELNIAEVELLLWYSDMKLKEIKRQNILLPPINSSTRVSSPPPPQPSPPPPTPYQTPQLVDQGPVVGGSAQGGGNDLQMEPCDEVENDPFYMEMFRSTTGGSSEGANGMWRGESSNGNQSNNDMDYLYGFEHGFSNSFPGFP